MKIVERLKKVRMLADSNWQDVISCCGDVFVNYLNNQRKSYFDSTLDEGVNLELIEELKVELEKIINENSEPEMSGTAIWALGKLCDENYKNYFIGLLRDFRYENYQAMYQTMIALNNIDSYLFDDSSISLFDIEKNNSLVDKFLN